VYFSDKIPNKKDQPEKENEPISESKNANIIYECSTIISCGGSNGNAPFLRMRVSAEERDDQE
jgi:hypothetical protein